MRLNNFLCFEESCLFYLGFVQKNPSNNRTYWYDNQNSPKLNSWRGRDIRAEEKHV